jgi:transcriptional regulator NrdR family protein
MTKEPLGLRVPFGRNKAIKRLIMAAKRHPEQSDELSTMITEITSLQTKKEWLEYRRQKIVLPMVAARENHH